MGKLGNQQPRNSFSVNLDELDSFVGELKQIAKKHSVPMADVIQAKRVLVVRHW